MNPSSFMWASETVLVVAAAFLLAGLVKGVVGLGLPTVALPVLALALGLKEALVLVVVPAIATNVWQATVGGALLPLLLRLWSLLAMLAVGAWVGAGILARGDAQVLSGLLGLLLLAYASMSLARPQVPPPGRHEAWLSPLVGSVTGVITGMTGTFVIPGVLYLQAMGMQRDQLVQAMGIAFLVASLALGLGLSGHGLFHPELGLLSLVALPTAFLGMFLGQKVRGHLPEELFRKVFFCALLLMGFYLAARAFLASLGEWP